jgi:branched-chain amino acid transport system permease protein
LLTIRLGNLYVALVTLTFGLLAETLIFTRHIFAKDGIGVPVLRPSWVADDQSFAYLVLAVFIVLSITVVNLRRSTTGLAAAAVRFSEDGSRTIGLSVLGVKLLIGTVSTFIAAIGGGLLALNYSPPYRPRTRPSPGWSGSRCSSQSAYARSPPPSWPV